MERVFYQQGLPYILQIIWFKVINYHHDNALANYFKIVKIEKLVAKKYLWPTLRRDVEAYVKSCNVYLALKTVCHKPYEDLLSLPVPINTWKDLFIDFITSLPLLVDWKDNSYDKILVIDIHLTKTVHYEPIKTMKKIVSLVKIIINMMANYYDLPKLIFNN